MTAIADDPALYRRSPLATHAPVETGDGSYRVAERPFLAKLVVRADPRAAGKAIKAVTGCKLPKATLASTNDTHSVLWMGPDEYLVTGPADSEADLTAALAKAFGKAHHQIADVSDYYTVICVSGSFAREALARLSTLDLHPRRLKIGSAVGSHFGGAQAVMHVRDGPRGESFDFYIRWSMASYLWALLLEAARTKGITAPAKLQVNWSINPE